MPDKEIVLTFRLPTRRGLICGAQREGGIILLTLPRPDESWFLERLSRLAPGAARQEVDPAGLPAGGWLLDYLSGRVPRAGVSLDLSTQTPFRRRVLEATGEIPYGGTATYGQLAAQVGRPKAARAVGGAMHNNPLPLFIPCHRVVGSGGSLTGFGGGLTMKRELLDLEQGGEPFI